MAFLTRLAATLALVAAPVLGLAAPPMEPEAVLAISQAAIGTQTGDHVFTDQNGEPLTLESLRGKPLVVSLIFTSCSTVCPITTEHLREQAAEVRRSLGNDTFNVLTFGFDATGDRPAQLAGFASSHRIAREGNWFIASADPETTEAFLDELGFSYRAGAGGFDHITQTSILDADGRVYRQVYGEAFPLPVLMEPMKDLILGTRTRGLDPAAMWDRFTFLCTVYNPATGAYRFDYGIFFGIFVGALSLILTGLVIFKLWLDSRRALAGGNRRQELG
ncbi:MAG: SCO family protein [Rubellimicrobium sp.]|nr:SCO family protein [Rubellimicrobium sp.]